MEGESSDDGSDIFRTTHLTMAFLGITSVMPSSAGTELEDIASRIPYI
jgi:hypothetical protein